MGTTVYIQTVGCKPVRASSKAMTAHNLQHAYTCRGEFSLIALVQISKEWEPPPPRKNEGRRLLKDIASNMIY